MLDKILYQALFFSKLSNLPVHKVGGGQVGNGMLAFLHKSSHVYPQYVSAPPCIRIVPASPLWKTPHDVPAQDMTLAACRVALRRIRMDLRATMDTAKGEGFNVSSGGRGEGAAASDAGLVILSSATESVSYLAELLLPGRVSESGFCRCVYLCHVFG